MASEEKSLLKIFENVFRTISAWKAYLIGNGMEKVLIEALKLFEKLPENERTSEKLKEILKIGIEKEYQERKIIIKIR